MSKTVPQIFIKIDGIVGADLYPVRPQHIRLHIYAAERERGRKSSEAVHHAIAWYTVGVGVGVERVADRPRPLDIPRKRGNLPVCRDLSSGYLFYDLVYLFKGCH